MIFRCISFLIFFLSISQITSAQDTIYLRARDVAVINFHIVDDCPCSHIALENIWGYEDDYYFEPISIDSIVLIHVADSFLTVDWLLSEVRYLQIPDTISLSSDISYIASISVGYDMNYVVMEIFLRENLVYKEIRYGEMGGGLLGGFAHCCDSECQKNWNIIKKAIEKCDAKYYIPKVGRLNMN